MSKTRQQKVSEVQSIAEGMKTAKSIVLANFQGLKMKDMDELRATCRKEGIICIAAKKTLVGRALKEQGLDVNTKSFSGGVTVLMGQSDEVAPAQVVAEFAKTHDVMTVFGGVLEGAFIDAQKVIALSKLPSKQQLLGQLVGTINAPVSGFVNVLAGNLRGLVTVLGAIKDQKA